MDERALEDEAGSGPSRRSASAERAALGGGVQGQGIGAEAAKRALDVALSLVLLALVLPLCVVVTLSIRLESPGPILCPSPRLGRGGAPFPLFRFRTTLGPRGRLLDPAASRPQAGAIGCLLERARIDEVPALVNVLRGEMSLVGPRPVSPELARQMAARFPGYDRRHLVKPGLTGWAQVNGAGSGGAAASLQHDLYYVRHRGTTLDLHILALTVRSVLLGGTAR